MKDYQKSQSPAGLTEYQLYKTMSTKKKNRSHTLEGSKSVNAEETVGQVLVGDLNQNTIGRLSLEQLIQAAEILTAQGKTQTLLETYEIWIKQAESPYKFAAYFNYGVLLAANKQDKQAEEAYRNALALKPDFVQPRINLGMILERTGRLPEAIEEWSRAVAELRIGPTKNSELLTTALNQIGRAQESSYQYGLAEEALTQSLLENPRQSDVIHHWVHLRQKQCKWPVLEELPGVSKYQMLVGMSPLAMLAHADDPALQLLAAENTIKKKFKVKEGDLSGGRAYMHDRVRIGYLSGDLCTHAVGLLLPEVFESHDKSKFEIYAYDYSREDGTDVRRRIKNAIENFVQINQLSDEDAAQKILEDEIDILVDLHGLSAGARPGILALKPAPIQATYLGYIGTTAMPWIDYVIADRYSLPDELLPFYSERPMYVDCSCLPGDSKREVGNIPTRAAIGLPENAFVYASFNNAYKLNETMFRCWMEILNKVPNSVLWLIDDNRWATANLKEYAKRHNVDETRLVFTPRVMPADYRARMQLADLFLDNSPYNAGSTASDVLWMGLPILTLSGRTFVSRMAGGLLNHLGVPELIATSHDEYISKAVIFASNNDEFIKIKNRIKLAKNSTGSTIANDLAKSLERQYEKVYGHKFADSVRPTGAVSSKTSGSGKLKNEQSNAAVEGGLTKRKLLVEGWRSINHSFAMVNQNQILELLKEESIELYHKDYKFFLEHWKKTRDGSGFSENDLRKIDNLRDCDYSQVDVLYRIGSPIPSIVPGVKNITFMVTELGLTGKSFREAPIDLKSYTSNGNLIVTPSLWSRNRLIDFGFKSEGIRIIPHGVRTEIFRPINDAERTLQRAQLGIQKNELVVLNVGMPVWNKGLDILIKSFAKAVQGGKKARLIVKNNKELYGLGLEGILSTISNEQPNLLSKDVLASFIVIDSSLNLEQMRNLYSIADLYVSPYRAEGFNLPVIEAMACGTPVTVTAGGATDDFVTSSYCKKIPAIERELTLDDATKGKYLDPDEQALHALIMQASPGVRLPDSDLEVIKKLTWESAVKKMMELM